MLSGPENNTTGPQLLGQQARPARGARGVWPGLWLHRSVRRGGGLHRVAVHPCDPVLRTDQELELLVRDLHGTPELSVPGRRALTGLYESGRRCEAGERHVRSGIGRDGHGIDGDIEATPLKLSRCGQSHDAAADHGGPAVLLLRSHFSGHEPRSPGERHPGAPVAVVVDNGFAVEPLGSKYETRGPVWTQAHGRPNDAVPRDTNRREHERAFPT